MNKKQMLGRAVLAAATIACCGHVAAFAQDLGKDGAAKDPAKLKVSIRPYDKQQLLGAHALSDDAYRGRTVFLQRCAYCHDGLGQPSYRTMGPWLGAETVQRFTEDGVRAFVAGGTERMPSFRYALQPQQVNDVIAFLKTVSSDRKPTPEQMNDGKGHGPATASND